MFLPRAAPRLRLQCPHTTSMSWSRIRWPRAFRFQASGLWSAWRSLVLPQSVQNGWRRRARVESFLQVQSYPRWCGAGLSMVCLEHRELTEGAPH